MKRERVNATKSPSINKIKNYFKQPSWTAEQFLKEKIQDPLRGQHRRVPSHMHTVYGTVCAASIDHFMEADAIHAQHSVL